MSSGSNGISFHSEMDFQLFAVAPALQKLAPDRASALLNSNPETAKWLEKYPQGLESFDQNHSFHGGQLIHRSTFFPVDLRTFGNDTSQAPSLLRSDYGLEFTRADYPHYSGVTGEDFFAFFADKKSPEYAAYAQVVDEIHPDVRAAVSDVPVMREVPTTCGGPDGQWCSYAKTYPQAELVRTLAIHWTYASKEENARAALRLLPEALEQTPPSERCVPFADAADLYLRLGDGASAYGAVQRGLVAAAAMVAEESISDKPSVAQLLRPSTSCYQTLIDAGVNADRISLTAALDSIERPELSAFAKAMLARALLGVPERRRLLVYPGGGYSVSEGVGSYTDRVF